MFAEILGLFMLPKTKMVPSDILPGGVTGGILGMSVVRFPATVVVKLTDYRLMLTKYNTTAQMPWKPLQSPHLYCTHSIMHSTQMSSNQA